MSPLHALFESYSIADDKDEYIKVIRIISYVKNKRRGTFHVKIIFRLWAYLIAFCQSSVCSSRHPSSVCLLARLSVLSVCPCVNFSRFRLLQNHCANFTKLAQNILGWKGFKFSSNEGQRLSPRGDNYEIAKIPWQN